MPAIRSQSPAAEDDFNISGGATTRANDPGGFKSPASAQRFLGVHAKPSATCGSHKSYLPQKS